MISYDKRCIFIHIPKCGGTSIENVIWPRPEDLTEANLWWGFVSKYHNKYQTGGLQHLLARQVRSEVGLEIFNSFYKFTIVRNPWDRIVSQFAYMQTRPDLMDFIGMQPDTEFKAYLGLIQKKQHVQWMPQTDFILDQDGTLLVDKIGRLESIEKDSNEVFDILGVCREQDKNFHANRSERKSIDHYYDQESAEMVGEIYSSDISYLNYGFDSIA
jgi:hypothetical protein